MPWKHLTSWWLEEVASDDAYETVVTPLLMEVFRPQSDETYVDLGSGEGRVKRALESAGVACVAVELNEDLARRCGHATVVSELPSIPLREDSFGGAISVLLIEHLEDERGLFSETARVVRPGGVLALVCNHPSWTAPGSTPITDDDGETLWRPGKYFDRGISQIPAGEGTVALHHRSMGDLLSSAADAGWSLEEMIERPHHEIGGQSGIPRLLACRWRLLP